MGIDNLIKREELLKQKQRQKEKEQREKEEQEVIKEEAKEEVIVEQDVKFVPKNQSSLAGTRELVLVIDESYSMVHFDESVVKGYNTFLFSQKIINKNTYVTTTTFNEQVNIQMLRQKITDLPGITYKPFGDTALYDAIGMTIKQVRDSHVKIGGKGPEEVIFAIITDGEENSSIKYKGEDIKNMISLLKKENWSFVFLGATPEVCKQGEELGISSSNSFVFSTAGDVGKNIFSHLGDVLKIETSPRSR